MTDTTDDDVDDRPAYERAFDLSLVAERIVNVGLMLLCAEHAVDDDLLDDLLVEYGGRSAVAEYLGLTVEQLVEALQLGDDDDIAEDDDEDDDGHARRVHRWTDRMQYVEGFQELLHWAPGRRDKQPGWFLEASHPELEPYPSKDGGCSVRTAVTTHRWFQGETFDEVAEKALAWAEAYTDEQMEESRRLWREQQST